MYYLRYLFLEKHPDILGYYWNSSLVWVHNGILWFIGFRIVMHKSLFFKMLKRAYNILIYAGLTLVFSICMRLVFSSPYLTQKNIQVRSKIISISSVTNAKVGILTTQKSYSTPKDNVCQYIELVTMDGKTYKFNTFASNYTIVDFYEKYKSIIPIEVFCLEYSQAYTELHRFVSKDAKLKLLEFSKKMQ